MKNKIHLAIFALTCSALAHTAFAQETTTTVTSDGVVQQIVPTSSQIVVTSTTKDAPTKYTYTKSTTFVDGAGNTVTYDSIKPNTPARIYYIKQGDSYVVTKYVTNPTTSTQTVTTPATVITTPVAPVVEEETSTTTTTTTKE